MPVPPRAIGRIPVVSESATFSEEVALQTGRPVVYELVRKPPVEVVRVERFVVPPPAPPKMSWPSPTEERPVPPLPTVSAEARVSAPAELKEEVAVAPKYAVPMLEKRVEDALPNLLRPEVEVRVPPTVRFPAESMVVVAEAPA